MQQIDRMFDPTKYDQTGVKALLMSQVPFVRRDNKPLLNVLGEPMKAGPFHYWASEQSKDPVWRTLAERQLWIPEPSKSAVIGNKSLGTEYSRAITPDEYYDLIAKSGPKIRKALEGQLEVLRRLPQASAQAVVTDAANIYHTAAKAELK
jgi:hypothetical protein